jgi:hypothetical protein
MATFIWNTNNNGSWSDSSNWTPSAQPGTGDVIEINRPGALPIVTLDDSNQSSITIKELTSKEVFYYRNGNLRTDGSSTMTFDGDLSGDGVDEKNFKGVLVPGGDGFVDSPSVLGLTSSFLGNGADNRFSNNGFINVINHGYLVLGEGTPLPIINNNTINIGNGATPGRLVFGSNGWSNAGTINLNDGSELLLGGTFPNTAINSVPTATINRNGDNKIAIIGRMNLVDTLVLNSTTGNYVLDGGSIVGGNTLNRQFIRQTEGAKLQFAPLSPGATSFNTIQNLHRLEGGLDLSAEGSFLILKLKVEKPQTKKCESLYMQVSRILE